MPWLTPNGTPAGAMCRRLFIPDDPAWLAIISGALVPLTRVENWEKHGTATPEECAERAQQMLMQYFVDVCPESGGDVEVGIIVEWAGAGDIPPKYLACDGGTFLGSEYPELAAVFAYRHISGDEYSLPTKDYTIPVGYLALVDHSPPALGNYDSLDIYNSEEILKSYALEGTRWIVRALP